MKRSLFIKQVAMGGAGGALVLFVLAKVKSQKTPEMIPPEWQRRGLVRPPGAVKEDQYLSLCIRCQRCQEVCEADAIRLFSSAAGALEGSPYIVPELRACTLCLKCGEACPTGAIEILTKKEEARMGTAVVDEQLCVSHNGTGICGACFTICPLKGKAIKQGLHNRPTVNKDSCVGCGLCEEACIVERNKAIRVYTERTWV